MPTSNVGSPHRTGRSPTSRRNPPFGTRLDPLCGKTRSSSRQFEGRAESVRSVAERAEILSSAPRYDALPRLVYKTQHEVNRPSQHSMTLKKSREVEQTITMKPFKPVGLAVCCSFAIALAASCRPQAPRDRPTNGPGARLTGAWSGRQPRHHGTFTLQWTQSGSKLSRKRSSSRRTAVYRFPLKTDRARQNIRSLAPSALRRHLPPARCRAGRCRARSARGRRRLMERPQVRP